MNPKAADFIPGNVTTPPGMQGTAPAPRPPPGWGPVPQSHPPPPPPPPHIFNGTAPHFQPPPPPLSSGTAKNAKAQHPPPPHSHPPAAIGATGGALRASAEAFVPGGAPPHPLPNSSGPGTTSGLNTPPYHHMHHHHHPNGPPAMGGPHTMRGGPMPYHHQSMMMNGGYPPMPYPPAPTGLLDMDPMPGSHPNSTSPGPAQEPQPQIQPPQQQQQQQSGAGESVAPPAVTQSASYKPPHLQSNPTYAPHTNHKDPNPDIPPANSTRASQSNRGGGFGGNKNRGGSGMNSNTPLPASGQQQQQQQSSRPASYSNEASAESSGAALAASNSSSSPTTAPIHEPSEEDLPVATAVNFADSRLPEIFECPNTKTAPPAEPIKLATGWQLYGDDHESLLHDSGPHGANGAETTQPHYDPVPIALVKDLEMFWRLWRYVTPPSSAEIPFTYSFFRENISPDWEHPRNRKGGTMSICVYDRDRTGLNDRQNFDDVFQAVLLGCVGECFTECSSTVTGVMLKLRQTKPATLQIWTSHADNGKLKSFVKSLRETISPIIGEKPLQKIEFFLHPRMNPPQNSLASRMPRPTGPDLVFQ